MTFVQSVSSAMTMLLILSSKAKDVRRGKGVEVILYKGIVTKTCVQKGSGDTCDPFSISKTLFSAINADTEKF